MLEKVSSCYVVYYKYDLSNEKKQNPAGVDLFDPGDVQTVGDEGVSVSHLLDDLAGGLASTVSRLCVHENKQRVCLLGAPSDDGLQGGDVLEGVEGNHAVVMVPRQQEHRGVLDPITLWDTDVVEWRVPGERESRRAHLNIKSQHSGYDRPLFRTHLLTLHFLLPQNIEYLHHNPAGAHLDSM